MSVEFGATGFGAVDRWPSRCLPHGRPPVAHVRVPLTSPPRRRAHRFVGSGVLGIIAAAAEAVAELRRIWVDNWPVCERCHRRRRRLRLMTRIMAWGGGVSMIVGCVAGVTIRAVTDEYAPPWLMAPVLVGLASLLASTIPLTYAQPSRIARAWVTRDGERVRLIDPDPEFVREVRRLLGEGHRAGQDG